MEGVQAPKPVQIADDDRPYESSTSPTLVPSGPNIKSKTPSAAFDELKPDLDLQPEGRRNHSSISPAEQSLSLSQPLADCEQSVGSKVVTNYQQTTNKLPTEVVTNYQQTTNKVVTAKRSTNEKVPTKVPTEVVTNYQQTTNKLPTKHGFLGLSGLQRNLVIFLYQLCRMRGERELENIRIDYLASSLETTAGAVKETVRRLERKSLIRRVGYRNGRGGSSNYSLLEETYKELFQLETTNKLPTNYQQTTNKVVTEVPTKVPTTASSSSSDLYINNKTTTGPTDRLAWIEGINLDSLQSVGVTQSVLLRCCELYPTITPEAVEDLVYRFAEFMKSPKNKVQNARGFFIGLAKQLSEGITPLDHIETSNDRLMREYTEKRREKKELQHQFEQEAMEFAFADWVKKLSPEGRSQVVSESQFAKLGSPGHDAMLKKHFRDNVWPEKREQIQRGEG